MKISCANGIISKNERKNSKSLEIKWDGRGNLWRGQWYSLRKCLTFLYDLILRKRRNEKG